MAIKVELKLNTNVQREHEKYDKNLKSESPPFSDWTISNIFSGEKLQGIHGLQRYSGNWLIIQS